MTKRLQVLLDDDELRDIQRIAKRERMTTAEWVRQRLREARTMQDRPSVESKLAAIRTASAYRFPAPDIEQMLDEIEQGYLSESASR